MFTPNDETMACWRWASTQHRQSRVHHSLHGMSVPHTLSEKQMLGSYRPVTSWKTLAEVTLQQQPPHGMLWSLSQGWGPNYPIHFCLVLRGQSRRKSKGSDMRCNGGETGSDQEPRLSSWRLHPLGQQISNSSRAIGVLTLLPSQDQLNRHPEPLGHLPLLKTHLADVRQGKKKHRKTILENGTSFKMCKIKRQKQNKTKNPTKIKGEWVQETVSGLHS